MGIRERNGNVTNLTLPEGTLIYTFFKVNLGKRKCRYQKGKTSDEMAISRVASGCCRMKANVEAANSYKTTPMTSMKTINQLIVNFIMKML